MELEGRMDMIEDSVLIWKMWPRDFLKIQCKRARKRKGKRKDECHGRETQKF